MAIISWILNRIGDVVSGKPSELSLGKSLSQFQERKNHLQAANMALKKKFDTQYRDLIRHIANLTTADEISPKDYRQIENLCSGFLTMPKEGIETEKIKAMEAVRIGKDRATNVKIMLLAGTALEIAENNAQIKEIDKNLEELRHELSRIKRVP